MKQSHILFEWHGPVDRNCYRAAVSLHGHTMHSRESMKDLERYVRTVGPIAWHVATQLRVEGDRLDATGSRETGRYYWTLPLPPREAHNLERRHIEATFDLVPLISLTDHDSIDAGCNLQVLDPAQAAPVSLEWTVPGSRGLSLRGA